MLEKGDVRRIRRVGSTRFENRANGGRQGERIEGNFELVVDLMIDGESLRALRDSYKTNVSNEPLCAR